MQEQKETINDLLKSENVNNNLLFLSKAIESRFKNWFTIEKLKKIEELKAFDDATKLSLMSILCMKGFAHHKNEKNTDKFKIILSIDKKIKLLQEDIEFYKNKINFLESEITRLQSNIK